jgi:hypothetical protein
MKERKYFKIYLLSVKSIVFQNVYKYICRYPWLAKMGGGGERNSFRERGFNSIFFSYMYINTFVDMQNLKKVTTYC